MISIIGGGPAGNYLAALLAKNGKKVYVYEEHSEIGKPVQCAGIITSDLDKFVEIKEKFLVNEVNKIRIYLAGKKVDFDLKRTNYILDRAKFDKYLAEKAMEYGVEYKLGWKFLGFENGKLKFNRGKKDYDILVGADGAFSKVAKYSGLWQNRKFFVAAQITARKKVDREVVEGYIDEGYFGYVIPENGNRARIGIVAIKNVGNYFKKFLDKLNVKKGKFQSGFIPFYNPKTRIRRENIFLLGDAALQVKATSCGGILQGLMAAQELKKTILYNYDYEKLCKRRFGLDLYTSLLIRRKLEKFKRKHYEYAYGLVNQPKIKTILENYDRDYAARILFKAGVTEPRFLRFLF